MKKVRTKQQIWRRSLPPATKRLCVKVLIQLEQRQQLVDERIIMTLEDMTLEKLRLFRHYSLFKINLERQLAIILCPCVPEGGFIAY